MAETLFRFDESNYRECQSRFRGDDNQEYYLGDLTIPEGSVVDIQAERRIVGPISIIRLKARTQHHFRRTYAHIRKDAADLAVLWFVKRGRLLNLLQLATVVLLCATLIPLFGLIGAAIVQSVVIAQGAIGTTLMVRRLEPGAF